MIQPQDPAEGGAEQPADEAHQIAQFPLSELPHPSVTYRPNGLILQLDWKPTETVGKLIIPQKSQASIGLPFFKVRVIAAGPECKLCKAGDYILIPQQAIMPAKWDGGLAYFTSESKVMAVIDQAQ